MNTENKFNYVLVGGTFNDNKGKESGVVNKLYHALGTFNSVMYNGGNYFDLVGNALSSITETDLIIWMADVDNAKEVSNYKKAVKAREQRKAKSSFKPLVKNKSFGSMFKKK